MLVFRAVELVSRRVAALEAPRPVVLDLRRVAGTQLSATPPLFADLAAGLAVRGARLAFAGAAAHDELVNRVAHELAGRPEPPAFFPDLDHALEWCEVALLRDAGGETDTPAVELSDHEVLRGLAPEDLALLLPALRERDYEPGAVVFEEGDPADDMFLITRGDVSVSLRTATGRARRVATLCAGMLFGELALVNREPRTATVTADTHVACYALSFTDLERFGLTQPTLKAALLEGILRVVGRMARRLSTEVSTIAE